MRSLKMRSSNLRSHPIEEFDLEYFKDDPSLTIGMVKDCPTCVAIDHKKTGFLTEDLIKNLTPDEANVLWDFAVHFVLLDVLRVIADTHCVFPVTRDMLNSLANAPFVYSDCVDIRSFYPSWCDSPEEFEEFLFFSSDDSQKAYFLYHGPTPFDLLEMMTFLSEQKGCFMESGLLGYFAKIIAHYDYEYDDLMFSNCPLKWQQDYFRWTVKFEARSMMLKSCENVQQAAHKTMLGSALPDDIVWEINQKYLALRASDHEKNEKLVREYMENREVASYEYFSNWYIVLMRNRDMLWNIQIDRFWNRENRINRLVRLVKVCRVIKYFLAYVGLSRGVFVTVRWIARKLASRNKC